MPGDSDAPSGTQGGQRHGRAITGEPNRTRQRRHDACAANTPSHSLENVLKLNPTENVPAGQKDPEVQGKHKLPNEPAEHVLKPETEHARQMHQGN